MKIRILGSYGFAGTDFYYTEDIPEDIVEAGEVAIQEYIEDEQNYVWEDMCQRLELSITLVEE